MRVYQKKYSIYCMLYLLNSGGGGPAEQQAKAVGNKDNFIKNIPICVCIIFFCLLKL